ncbi:MAG: amidohydrolase family protein [Gemmatimonadetes bacterium]|nr:amidohydrolase family protein [Gemmatimonadota bacterium]MBT7860109.1 amidohydrolase family protein [Gemmatimonadota bacterium]
MRASVRRLTFVLLAATAASVAAEPTSLTANAAALDAHTHLISQALLDGLTGGGMPNLGADELIARLDEAHVDKAVVLSLGYFPQLDEAGSASENDYAAGEVARYPDRLIGFCGINPMLDGALAEVDRCLALPGMVGVKLQGAEFDWEDPDQAAAISAVLTRAGQLDAPVMLHVNAAPLDARAIMSVLQVLGENRGTRITIAHAGGMLDIETDTYLVTEYSVPPLIDRTNLYMDLSAHLEYYEDAPLSKRELMVWRFRKWGIQKLFFGSDYLSFAPAQTPAEALETLVRYPFTQEEIDTIASNDGSAWLVGE